MPNNWKTYKLKEVCEKIFSGGTPSTSNPEFWNGEIPWLSSGETGNRYIDKTEKSITEIGLQKSSAKMAFKDDVVIASAGQGKTRGQTSFLKIDTSVNQSVLCFRADKDIIDSKFLFFNLSNRYDEFRNISDSFSTRGSLTKDLIENQIKLDLPPLKEQKSIAAILSAIDDKIENNLVINKTLEEMAMALYKHWFVDFGPFQDGEFVESELGKIPKGWEVKIFSELYEIKKGLSYKSKFYSDKGIPMINLKCVDRNGGFRYDGVKYYEGEYKRQHVVLPGDLLVAMTDLTQDRTVLGSPLIAPKLKTTSDLIASLDISILKQKESKTSDLNLFFYYQMRTHKYHEYILGYGNGSTVMHLDKKGLLDYTCFLPSNDVLEKFNELVSDLRNRIELNIIENQPLIQLRDTLLPKLISGEVRLKEFRESITN